MIYTLLFTGLPCSGKTTLTNALHYECGEIYNRICHLDGDSFRKTYCKDLGFSPEDRRENLRRAAEKAKSGNRKEFDVLASFIAPTSKVREMVREIIGEGFRLVYVKCLLKVCEERDIKGMYAKARRGEIEMFTGIDAPYEEPMNPDLVVNTYENDLDECVRELKEFYDELREPKI